MDETKVKKESFRKNSQKRMKKEKESVSYGKKKERYKDFTIVGI